MYYYSTVTSKISNVVIFTNHIFSAYILPPTLAMSTSTPILSAVFPHAIRSGHTEDSQIYILERP